jgi:hypothetical protein
VDYVEDDEPEGEYEEGDAVEQRYASSTESSYEEILRSKTPPRKMRSEVHVPRKTHMKTSMGKRHSAEDLRKKLGERRLQNDKRDDDHGKSPQKRPRPNPTKSEDKEKHAEGRASSPRRPATKKEK